MTTPRKKQPRGEEARDRIFETALALFRKNGFDATTMRDIALEAGVALGGAYYYFRSKHEIVHAYYERLQLEHSKRVRDVFANEVDLRRRLGAVFHTSLDLLKRDRRFISGLFPSVGAIDSASPFGPATEMFRARSVSILAEALSPLSLQGETLSVLTAAGWAGHMAMILYLLHDDSNEQERTRQLIDGILDIAVPMLPMLSMFEAPLQNLGRVLHEAGLLSSKGSNQR